MTRRFFPLPARLNGVVAVSLLFLGGCATQESLNQQSLSLQERLARLEQLVEANAAAAQAQGGELAGKLDRLAADAQSLRQQLHGQEAQMTATQSRLDQIASQAEAAAGQAAAAAQGVTSEAAARAALAERVTQAEMRLDEATTLARQAMDMAAQSDILVNGKVVHSVTLTEDRTLYPINLPDLHGRDAAQLDELAARLNKMENENYHLEIQGHTDNLGTDDYNYQLAKARAEVAKRYLHEKGGIALNRMSVISYGATTPLDLNGRSNRRIAILVRVLE